MSAVSIMSAIARMYELEGKRKICDCEECGMPVYSVEDTEYEEDMPYFVERIYLHERCVIDYAKENWKLR